MIILKNQLNHLNFVILKKFCILRNILQNVLFFFTNLSWGNSLYYFFKLKILILPILLLKWNKICCIEYFLSWFSSVCQDTEHQPRRVWSFSQSCKISFFNDNRKWTENTIPVLLSRRIINKLFPATTNILLHKFRLKESLKLV